MELYWTSQRQEKEQNKGQEEQPEQPEEQHVDSLPQALRRAV
jgi:hypothetical protein